MRFYLLLLLLAFAPSVSAQNAGPEETLFTIVVHETAADFAARTDATRAGAYWQSFAEYGQEMAAAGILRGGTALDLNNSQTVRVRQGMVNSSPIAFTTTDAAISGYFIIAVPDLETAVSWAAKCPSAASSYVEVRSHVPNARMQP